MAGLAESSSDVAGFVDYEKGGLHLLGGVLWLLLFEWMLQNRSHGTTDQGEWCIDVTTLAFLGALAEHIHFLGVIYSRV